KVTRGKQHVGPRLRHEPAARHAAQRERGGDGSENVAPVEGGAKRHGPPGDAPALAATRALPEDGKEAIVRADELAAIDAGHDGVAPAADARVDDGEEYGVRRILGRERGEEMGRRLDAESRRIVQCV